MWLWIFTSPILNLLRGTQHLKLLGLDQQIPFTLGNVPLSLAPCSPQPWRLVWRDTWCGGAPPSWRLSDTAGSFHCMANWCLMETSQEHPQVSRAFSLSVSLSHLSPLVSYPENSRAFTFPNSELCFFNFMKPLSSAWVLPPCAGAGGAFEAGSWGNHTTPTFISLPLKVTSL